MSKRHIDRDYQSFEHEDPSSAFHGERGGAGGCRSGQLAPQFFEERGILLQVAEARPYTRYEAGDPDGIVRRAWPDNPRFAARIAKHCGGIVIPRSAPPGLRLRRVPAELRPDRAVSTDSHWHYHGDEPVDLVIPSTGNPLPRKWTHRPEAMSKHIEKVHGGVNVQTVHLDENLAKYVFPPGNGAKRLDVHPEGWTRFVADPVVFFGLEGCIKADAMFSAGKAVYSVPSVTLWNAPEHRQFARRYLVGKTVYIVCDSDWYENHAVITQAMFSRTFLRRLGVDAHVCAPPAPGGIKVGVDDHLGDGGSMSDLVVIERETPYGLAEFLAERGIRRSDAIVRDAEVLEALSLHAGSDGTIQTSLRSFSRIMGLPLVRVQRAIEDLREVGAITVDGSLETRAQYFDWKTRKWVGLDWTERPTLTITKGLCARDTRRRLADSD
jgi:hypothetical protein